MAQKQGYWLFHLRRHGRPQVTTYSVASGRVHRRGFLQGIALGGAGLAAAALIGCGKGKPAAPPASPATKQPKRGGFFTHKGAYELDGTTLDPYVQALTGVAGYRLWYQALLGYDPETYDVEPELAQKWEQPSPTEYLFTLQPGVKWHNKPPANGRPLTAADIVFSLERARTNDPKFFSRSLLVAVDKIEAVAQNMVRLTTKEPTASLITNLSADILLILAPEVVERAGKFATADTVVGTGPFILQSVEIKVASESVRNPDYWKPGLPYLDGFRTRYFATDQLAYAAFQAGRLDTALVPGTETSKYIAQQGPNASPVWFKDTGGHALFPNVRRKPMDDRRVTRALKLLIDHEEMITSWAEVWRGRGRNGSILPTALDTWDFSHAEYYTFLEWKQPKDDAVKEALALLNAAGFSKDKPLKFEVAGGDTEESLSLAALTQDQWKRFSQGVVDVSMKVFDNAARNQARASGEFTFWAGPGVAAGIVEIDATLSQLFLTGGSRNYAGFSDPRVDDMIKKQRTLFDVQQRKALVKEIILYMIDNGVFTLPANRYFLNGLKPYVRGFRPEFLLNGRQYEWVWLDT